MAGRFRGAPGLIDTAQIRGRHGPGDKRLKSRNVRNRLPPWAGPQDVANAVTLLASFVASYKTGTVMLVDGGMRRHSF